MVTYAVHTLSRLSPSRPSIDGEHRRLAPVAVRWSCPIGAHNTIRELWTTLTFIFNPSISPRNASFVCARQNGSQALTSY